MRTPGEGEVKQHLIDQVDRICSSMCELSDRIHARPEVGLEEHAASGWIAAALRMGGFEVVTGVGGLPTAFRAGFRSGQGGTTACLVAEYDALPVLGHACGHNVSGVASLAAALALSTTMAEHSLDGTIIVLGTPAEESHAGKVTLIEAGAFDGIDFCMMAHMYHRNEMCPVFLALDAPRFTFTGKAVHAAGAPHLGVNALNAVRLTFSGIDALRQHVTEDVRIHGIITAGGDAPNVVPDRAAADIFVRARDREYLEKVTERVTNCARGAAIATGASLEVSSFERSTHNLRTDRALIDVFRRNWHRFAPDIHEDGPAIGSTDVGNVSHIMPTIHPMFEMAPAGTPLHSSAFAEAACSSRAHEALAIAAKTMGMTVLDLLMEPELMRGLGPRGGE